MFRPRLFTKGDICQIADVPAPRFESWCREGLIKPVAGGDGTGNHRVFSLMQVIGLAVGIALRNSEKGCALPYIGKVVDAFGNISEEALLKHFDEGHTHFISVLHGKPWLDGKAYDWVDVRAIYRNVLKAAS